MTTRVVWLNKIRCCKYIRRRNQKKILQLNSLHVFFFILFITEVFVLFLWEKIGYKSGRDGSRGVLGKISKTRPFRSHTSSRPVLWFVLLSYSSYCFKRWGHCLINLSIVYWAYNKLCLESRRLAARAISELPLSKSVFDDSVHVKMRSSNRFIFMKGFAHSLVLKQRHKVMVVFQPTTPLGFAQVMKNLESHGICYFNFQVWKVMEFKWRSWKVMEKQYALQKDILKIEKRNRQVRNRL